ncbi:MAG: glycosyltransferase family 4 protein [Dysgonomonas sp.]|nr:glycosyltransferase family 4 protein [Dysgonomonas sp.]
MNITYITNFPSIDVKYWSGTIHFMAESLAKKVSVDYITDLEAPDNLSLKIKRKLYGRVKKYWTDRSPEISKGYARQIQKRLNSATDAILSHTSIPLAYLNTNKPMAFYTDATFAAIVDYYHYYSDFSSQYIKEGMRTERMALENSNLAIYASDWAAESAIRDYDIDPEKVRVVPFGANLDKAPSLDDIRYSLNHRNRTKCKLLFLGVEWERKGADIVIKAAESLIDMGLDVEVHIVGIPKIPMAEIPSFVINHGFINKGTAEGRKKMEVLMSESHFLFVPSRAEAYGVVFCEAMAFGVPCVSTMTGGIPTIIKNGLNGIILDIEATAIEYAKAIYETFADSNLYNEIALSAYDDFVRRLNWDVAMDKVVKYMKEI